jgi:hypothetical protein
MDSVEKFIRDNCWRFPKGYPDLSNPKDKALLFELVEKQQLEEEEQQMYSYEDLMRLIQTKKDLLDPKFIQKLYHTIEGKGQKLGGILQKVFTDRKLAASSNELFGIIHEYPGLEKQLVDVLDSSEKQISLQDLAQGDNIITVANNKTKLPTEFLVSLLKAGKSTEAGKGVGEGEALLALLGREGRKMDVGDVQIQGKELEIKGRDGRLIGRGEDLKKLYLELAQLGVEPRKVAKGLEALHTYIPYILQAQPKLKNEVEKLLEKEFKTSFNVDLTNSDEVKNALLEWYVDYFTANEGKNADYVMVIMGDKYKFLNKEQFKQAILSGDITVKNFSASNKSPNITGFA